MSRYNIHKIIGVQLIHYSGMLSQLQNWIIREPILSYGSNGPHLSLYTLMAQFMMVSSALSSIMHIRMFW